MLRPSIPRLLALLLAASGVAEDGAPRVSPGEPVELRIEAPLELTVAVPAEGAWTLLVSSAEADPYVELLDADGTVLDRDDDGGVEWNARLLIDADDAATLRAVAGFASGVGTVRVELVEGVHELEGVELQAACAAFGRARGRALLAEGEPLARGTAERRDLVLRAAFTLHEAGTSDFKRMDYAACHWSYSTVLQLAAELRHDILGATSLAYLGAVYVRRGELEHARTHLDEAQRWLDESADFDRFAGTSQLQLFVASFQGELHLELSELTEARADFERALRIARELGETGNEIALRSKLAQATWRAGDLQSGAERVEEALAAARKHGDPALLAGLLGDAARFQRRCCNVAQARTLVEEGLALPAPERVRSALTGLLGALQLATGDAAEALASFSDVLAFARRSGDLGLQTEALQSSGDVALRLGDYGLARERLGEARALLGDEGPRGARIHVLCALAIVDLREGEHEAARTLIDDARTLAASADDRGLAAHVEAIEAAYRYRSADYAGGLEVARTWLAIGEELEQLGVQAGARRCIAEFELRLGDLERARRDAVWAVEAFRALGATMRVQEALLTLVEVEWREGDVDAMRRCVEEAEECLRSAPRLDPERGALLRAQESYALWGTYSQELVAAEVSRASDDDELNSVLREGLRRAGLWKARGLWQGIAEHRLGYRNDETSRLARRRDDLLAEYEGVRAELEEALKGKRDSGDDRRERLSDVQRDEVAEGLRERLAGVQRAIDGVVAQLRRSSPSDAALDAPEGVAVDELSVVREGRCTFVEFVDGRERLYAYRVRGEDVEFLDLGEREPLREQVRGFVAGMSRADRLAPPPEIARRGRALFEALLKPVWLGVEGERLLVVPSATVAGLPFEALVVDAPEAPPGFDDLVFVLDRAEVTYAASTPVLALLERTGARATPGPALVVADAVYRGDTGELLAEPTGRPRGWDELPGTRGEALVLAARLQAALDGEDFQAVYGELADAAMGERSVSLARDAFVLHLGGRATPARLQAEDARDYSIVHCASHGWLDAEDWHRSGLVLSPDESGDDFLSVREILDLDLDADLAVLSACETGRGEVLRAEGVLSLARAFQYAGARNVVASLWPVEDQATRRVMGELYARGVRPAATISGSLRAARLAVRRGDSEPGATRGRSVFTKTPPRRSGHPYFWAAFVASGLPDASFSLTPP